MSLWGNIAKWGLGIGAAPFTGGQSLWPAIISTGVKAGAGYGLGKLLGGGGDKQPKPTAVNPDDPSNMLATLGQEKANTGKDLVGSGGDAIAKVLAHLKNLTGTDPAALLAATAPERRRVMDQYDTARRAISQFAPRGGASSSAFADATFREAGDLADVTNTARRDAFSQMGQLGQAQVGLGLSAEQLASQDFDSVLRAILTREGIGVQKRGQNMEAWSGIGEAAGSILADIFLNKKKKPA